MFNKDIFASFKLLHFASRNSTGHVVCLPQVVDSDERFSIAPLVYVTMPIKSVFISIVILRLSNTTSRDYTGPAEPLNRVSTDTEIR